jgi:hypothetical protein
LKLLELFVDCNFAISTPRCPTYYTPDRQGDVLDAVHQNLRLAEVIVIDIVDSDHLPIIFAILDCVRAREALDPFEKLRDWERFQSLTSELISLSSHVHSSEEADKAARDFAASIA